MQTVGLPDSKEKIVDLDGDIKIRIRKWSMRKSLSLGRVITDLYQSMMVKLRDLKRSQYEIACEEAKAEGLTDGDPEWPDEGNYEEATENELLGVLPQVVETAANQFALLISESIAVSASDEKWTADRVLDEMTFSDIPAVIEAIVVLNFSGDSLGKWKRLLSGEAFRSKKRKK